MSDENVASVPEHRRFVVSEPPFLVEGMILLDRIAGRGIQTDGAWIVQRRVLDFLADVPAIGFENAVRWWAEKPEMNP